MMKCQPTILLHLTESEDTECKHSSSAISEIINKCQSASLTGSHAQAITEPPPCLTDEVVYFGSWACTFFCPLSSSFWQWLLFLSSLFRNLLQNLSETQPDLLAFEFYPMFNKSSEIMILSWPSKRKHGSVHHSSRILHAYYSNYSIQDSWSSLPTTVQLLLSVLKCGFCHTNYLWYNFI